MGCAEPRGATSPRISGNLTDIFAVLETRLPRSKRLCDTATAQRLGIGQGGPGQPRSERFTSTTYTPYNSVSYLPLVRVVGVVRVKRQIVWGNRLAEHQPGEQGT